MNTPPGNVILPRRSWLKSLGMLGVATWADSHLCHQLAAADSPRVINIGSRRELMIDDHLIDSM
ncbi:MAG: hypothetical protein VX644_17740, partial [Planctomycetota bacterium]|nr:hypothetical protein [Planctomycetota bacterium]